MGEIDDAHQPHRHHQADGDQAQHEAVGHAIEDNEGEDGHQPAGLSSMGSIRATIVIPSAARDLSRRQQRSLASLGMTAASQPASLQVFGPGGFTCSNVLMMTFCILPSLSSTR